MKANRSRGPRDDEAVSPVIAVILMVAITVVLAATVYVWVSGFGTSGAIKRFPQLSLKDGSYDVPSASTADNSALAQIEHRGGDTINWADYTVKTFRAGTATTGTSAVDFATGSSPACTTTVATLSGAYAVGDKFLVCTANASPAWVDGDELKVQIIDNNQNAIVYENTVVVT